MRNLRYFDPDNLTSVQPATICWLLAHSPKFYSFDTESGQKHRRPLVAYTLCEPEVSTKLAAQSDRRNSNAFRIVLAQQLCEAFLSVPLGVVLPESLYQLPGTVKQSI